MKLDNNNHSVFLLNYQLIMCTKHRNKVIDDVISNRLREMFENLSVKYNISLDEWNHDENIKRELHVFRKHHRDHAHKNKAAFQNVHDNACEHFVHRWYTLKRGTPRSP